MTTSGRKMMTKKRFHALLALLLAISAPAISPEAELTVPEAGSFRPSDFRQEQSLDGQWEFSGLSDSKTPFPQQITAEELSRIFTAPPEEFRQIRVPLNWFEGEQPVRNLQDGKTRRIRPNFEGGPCFAGWYRRTLELPEVPAGKRILLEFDAIGYEAQLFVNGKPAGRHHGYFIPYTADITNLVHPGQNTIALRVLADFSDHNGKWRYTYGAVSWGRHVLKGGIWQSVRLVTLPELHVTRMPLKADMHGELILDYQLNHRPEKPLTPGIAVISADDGKVAAQREFPATEAREGRFSLKVEAPKLWSPEHPALYYAVLYLRDGKNLKTVHTSRFGFRTFEVSGTDFKLNGKKIQLLFESAHSVHYGGHPSPSGHQRDPRKTIEQFKAAGYNMLRTAHMPIVPEFLEAADEAGMMINSEWGTCFLTYVEEKDFEKNNLSELEIYLYRDHNHPSVVMWTLGNEVKLNRDPAVPRQMDKQTALVRRLDLQKRPICAAAANGNVEGYGKIKLDTDVIDFHSYTGITMPYTLWNRDFQHLYDEAAKVYGKNGKIDKPITISECVGGGWGFQKGIELRPGDIEEYLKLVQLPYTFAQPGAAGYSGVIGVEPAINPKKQRIYLQNLIGRRILGLIRQDDRIAGAAPWFADPAIASAAIWNQNIYPGIRLNAEDGIAPLQFYAGGTREVEAFVFNQRASELKSPLLSLEFETADGKRFPAGSLQLEKLPNGGRAFHPVTLRIPDRTGTGMLHLTVLEDGKAVARNFYEVTFHKPVKPYENAKPVAVIDTGDVKALRAGLDLLGIPYRILTDFTTLPEYQAAILPSGKVSPGNAAQLRSYVERGGRLLVLEPEIGAIPGFPEYRCMESNGSLVDLAIPAHPAFESMCPADFDTWAENPSGLVTTGVIAPLDRTALAIRGGLLKDSRIGAVLTEAAIGRGRLMISTMDALGLWGRNPAASHYLANLLGYQAGVRPLHNAKTIPQSGLINCFAAIDSALRTVTPGNSREQKIGKLPFQVAETPFTDLPLQGRIAALYCISQGKSSARVRYADGRETRIEFQPVVSDSIPDGMQVGYWNNPLPDHALSAIHSDGKFLAVTVEHAPEQSRVIFNSATPKEIAWTLVTEPSGKPPYASQIKTGTPAGAWCWRIQFPKHEATSKPVAIMKFTPELRPDDRTSQVLSMLVRVTGNGTVALELPEARWLSVRTRNLELKDSRGEWIRLRFPLAYFRFTAGKFPFSDMRPEISFRKTASQLLGVPGEAMNLEIADLRFE